MTRLETPFAVDGDLIIVEVRLVGPHGPAVGKFVLDTGAAVTTMTPETADLIGYSARDAFKRTRVHSAISEEEGYVVHVAELAALGFVMPAFPINVFDLGHEGLDGLLGMNYLSDFNVDIRPSERRLLVEKIAP